MTAAQKAEIKRKAWSLPHGKTPGKLLFTEKTGQDVYYYYEADEPEEYWYDTESQIHFRMDMANREKKKKEERRRLLA